MGNRLHQAKIKFNGHEVNIFILSFNLVFKPHFITQALQHHLNGKYFNTSWTQMTLYSCCFLHIAVFEACFGQFTGLRLNIHVCKKKLEYLNVRGRHRPCIKILVDDPGRNNCYATTSTPRCGLNLELFPGL